MKYKSASLILPKCTKLNKKIASKVFIKAQLQKWKDVCIHEMLTVVFTNVCPIEGNQEGLCMSTTVYCEPWPARQSGKMHVKWISGGRIFQHPICIIASHKHLCLVSRKARFVCVCVCVCVCVWVCVCVCMCVKKRGLAGASFACEKRFA